MRRRMDQLGAHPRWWVIFVLSAAVFATIGALLPRPWSWVLEAPVVVFGIWLFDAHARYERDETQRRVRGE